MSMERVITQLVNETLNNKRRLELESLSEALRRLDVKGDEVASGETITLGQGNLFTITGTTTTSYITATGWTSASIITLFFDDSVTIENEGGSAVAPAIPIKLAGGIDSTFAVGDNLTLIYDGSYWVELCRGLINPSSTSSIFVLKTGDSMSGDLTMTGSSGIFFTDGSKVFELNVDYTAETLTFVRIS